MAELYARRTLVVYRVWFNEPRKTDEVFRIDDVVGHDALSFFEDFCREENGLIQLRESERFLRIKDITRDDDWCFASIQSGRAGVVGSVVNTMTAEEAYGYGASEAGMVSSRFMFLRRRGYGYAIACVERVPNDAGSTAMLSAFANYFRNRKVRATFKCEQVKQEQALKAFKGIEDIEVRRYTKKSDRSDGLNVESKYISHIAKHKRGRLFPLHIARDIVDDKRSLTSMLGIPETFEGREDIRIRLKGMDGSSRTFVLGDDIHVPFVEVLNDSGERPLSDNDFLNRCNEITESVCDHLDRMI